jgi:hypothetical protein
VKARTRDQLLRDLVRRDGQRCRYCPESDLELLTIEHLVPMCRGGKHAFVNLAISCFRCNSIKDRMTDVEFLAYIQERGGHGRLPSFNRQSQLYMRNRDKQIRARHGGRRPRRFENPAAQELAKWLR